jgi:hypothetical protein
MGRGCVSVSRRQRKDIKSCKGDKTAIPIHATTKKLTLLVACSYHVCSDYAWALAERVECLDTMPSSDQIKATKCVVSFGTTVQPQYEYAYPREGIHGAGRCHIKPGDSKGGEEEQGHEWCSD